MGTREFLLPDLGEGLEDAEVVRWLVSAGQEVALNQPLVEVDTAKALVEIPSPFAGKVATLHAEEGDVVKVGAALVTFDVVGDAPEPSDRKAVLVGYGVEEGAKPERRRRLKSRTAPAATTATTATGATAAPPVRRLARELGVDLGSIAGTGPGGRITRDDVAAAVPTESSAGDEDRIPVKGVRRLVAKKMTEAASTIPHVTTFLTVDASALVKAWDGSPLPLVARAFVEVCKEHPKLNASWDNEFIVLKRYYHLGVATDTERGLLVPVVKDADLKTVAELTTAIARVTGAARDGTTSVEELTGSTVTISNVGTFGAEFGTPIINPPESAILALGVMQDRAMVHQGEVVVRPAVTLSLSFDHRIMDGAEAGRALLDLKHLLEDPQRLAAFSG